MIVLSLFERLDPVEFGNSFHLKLFVVKDP